MGGNCNEAVDMATQISFYDWVNFFFIINYIYFNLIIINLQCDEIAFLKNNVWITLKWWEVTDTVVDWNTRGEWDAYIKLKKKFSEFLLRMKMNLRKLHFTFLKVLLFLKDLASLFCQSVVTKLTQRHHWSFVYAFINELLKNTYWNI